MLWLIGFGIAGLVALLVRVLCRSGGLPDVDDAEILRDINWHYTGHGGE